MREEKLYIGSKLILGRPMDECAFLREIKGEDVLSKQETRPGYKVTYPDGYISWSPKEAFEIAYREVTEAEKDLLLPPEAQEDPGNPPSDHGFRPV